MEAKHAAGAGLGVAHVGEIGLHARGLIEEGQGRVPGVIAQQVGQPPAVLGGLHLDAAEGLAHRLGLGHAAGCAEVGLVAGLDDPAGGLELFLGFHSAALDGGYDLMWFSRRIMSLRMLSKRTLLRYRLL